MDIILLTIQIFHAEKRIIVFYTYRIKLYCDFIEMCQACYQDDNIVFILILQMINAKDLDIFMFVVNFFNDPILKSRAA